MYRNSKLIISIIAVVLCCSCKKELSDASKSSRNGLGGLPKFVAPVVTIDVKNPRNSTDVMFTPESVLNHHKLNGVPGATSSTEPTGIRFRDGLTAATSIYTEMFNANEFVVNTVISNDIFPGSLIKGNSIGDFVLKGIYGYSKPITVSVSIPTSPQKVSKTISMPSSGAMRLMVRDALKNEFSGKGGVSSFNYEMKAFTYYQEMKQLYGYDSKTNLLFVSNTTTSGRNIDTISRKTGLMVKFLQQNFTIDMDIPEAGQLIDRSVDPALFGVSPLYVSSVTYGRLGIMTIETEEEESKATATFRKAFSFLGLINGSNNLTSEEISIIKAADIKVSVSGVNGEDAVRTIDGLQGLTDLIVKGLTYTPESPGVPIVFKMRYVSDDGNVAAPFEVNYGPFDKVYARFEYENFRYDQGAVLYGPLKNIGDVYLAFYKDPTCAVPTKAYNFIQFNYDATNEYASARQYAPVYNPAVSYALKTRNTPKGTRLLVIKDEVLRTYASYDTRINNRYEQWKYWYARVAGNNRYQAGMGENFYEIVNWFTLTPGNGYFPVATKEPSFEAISIANQNSAPPR